MNITYDELKKIDGVTAASSETRNNPLTDQEVTIFLESGTRVISSITLYGQGLEASTLNDDGEPTRRLFAEIYHDIGNKKFHTPENKYGLEENEQIQALTQDEFIDEFRQIVGPDLLAFLSARHEKLAFAAKVGFEKSEEPEDIAINPSKPASRR